MRVTENKLGLTSHSSEIKRAPKHATVGAAGAAWLGLTVQHKMELPVSIMPLDTDDKGQLLTFLRSTCPK